MPTISPMLWFDDQAEEAVAFYVSVFPNSRITDIAHYGEGMPGKAGSVLTVGFELNGQPAVALNGGPMFKFTEAVSFVIECKDQAEIDYYWDALTANGGSPSRCGWLKDRFGLSWQVVPEGWAAQASDPDKAKVARIMAAMMKMDKFDLAALAAAAAAG